MYIILTALLIFTLTACGSSIPELTEEEEQAISEYAVELITKHSKKGNNRLEDISELDEETIEASMSSINPAPIEEEAIEEEPAIELEDEVYNEEGSQPEEEIEVPVYSSMRIDQILGMDGIEITYIGSDVMDTYEPGENSYFSITASRGKKLVVLRFNILNTSASTMKLDMGQYDVKLSYGDGNGKKKKLDHTVTAKDIYSYQGYLEAGQSDTLIGIAELVESDIPSITEPVLAVNYMGQNSFLLLQ